MSFNKIILVIKFISAVVNQNIISTETSEIRSNNFYQNTNILNDVINELFTILKLNTNFTQSGKNRLLFTLHEDLTNIVRHNYKTNQIENITDSDNRPMNDFEYFNFLDVLLKDDGLLFPDSSIRNAISRIIDKSLLTDVITIIKELHSTFMVKAENNLSHEKLDKDVMKVKKNSTRRRLNLKPWVPVPNSREIIIGRNRRIYHSTLTSIKKYPFMASVHVDQELVCAGSIISKNLIITAASCLQVAYVHRYYKTHTNATVLIGENIHGSHHIPVTAIHFHPAYSPETLHNNLAILRTVGRWHSSHMTVRRILYDKVDEDFPDDVENVKILGWGATNVINKHNPQQKLSVAKLKLQDNKQCIKLYSKYYVTENNFCAGSRTKSSGACDKDVGDPAIVSGILVGVVSFGPVTCGTPNTLTVFTKVSAHASWINSIVKMKSRQPLQLYGHRADINQATEHPHRLVPAKYFQAIKYNYDYPEELLILREVLKEVTLSNHSILDKLINEGVDNIELAHLIGRTTKLDMIHSPLINKTFFPLNDNFPIKPFKQQPFTLYTTRDPRLGLDIFKRWKPSRKNKLSPSKFVNAQGSLQDSQKKYARLNKNVGKFKVTDIRDSLSDTEYETIKRIPDLLENLGTTGIPSSTPDYDDNIGYPEMTTKRKPTYSNDFDDWDTTKASEIPPLAGKPIQSNEYDYNYLDKDPDVRSASTIKSNYNDKPSSKTTRRPHFVGKPIHNNEYDYEYDDKNHGPTGVNNDRFSTKTTKILPFSGNPIQSNEYDYKYFYKSSEHSDNDKHLKKTTKRAPFVGKPVQSNNYDYEYYDKSSADNGNDRMDPYSSKITKLTTTGRSPIESDDYDDISVKKHPGSRSTYNFNSKQYSTSSKTYTDRKLLQNNIDDFDAPPQVKKIYSSDNDLDRNKQNDKSTQETIALAWTKDHAFDNYEAEYYDSDDGLNIEIVAPEKHSIVLSADGNIRNDMTHYDVRHKQIDVRQKEIKSNSDVSTDSFGSDDSFNSELIV